MKAKDLTQADVEKWVTLRAKIVKVDPEGGIVPNIAIEGDVSPKGNQATVPIYPRTILEFTDPPAPVQEVGDVFRTDHSTQDWTLAAIVNDVCLLIGPVENGQTNGFQSARYPLDRTRWTLVRKGTQS